MASTFCCGFECGAAGPNGQHWNNTVNDFSTNVVRSGLRSLRCNPTAQSTSSVTSTVFTTNYIVGRFYVYFVTLPNANMFIFNATSVGSTRGGLYFQASDSKLYAASSVTAVGATGFAPMMNRWYKIDVIVNHFTSPLTVDVSIDGVPLAQATRSISGAVLDGLTMLQSTTATCDLYIDDLRVSETQADFPLPGGKISPFTPTSDGTHNVAGAADFRRSATTTDITNATTTAYQLIDDVPLKSGNITEYINLIAPPNATDYVEVVFGPAPGIPTPTTPPVAVEAIVVRAKGTGAGANNLRVALNDNGTLDDVFNGDTGTVSPLATTSRKHYVDPPSAATAWTLSGNGNFNNVRMRCFTSDAAPDPWFASAMIEAEFADPKQKVVQVNQSVNRSNTY